MGTFADTGITITVEEPDSDTVGCITARIGGEFGPEVCYAVGREFGEWFVIVRPAAGQLAGMDRRTGIACCRQDAEYLVRLIAGLFERATLDLEPA